MPRDYRVDYEQLRRTIPIAAVLEKLGQLDGLKGKGPRRHGKCPFCGSGPRAFAVDLERQLFKCFSPLCSRAGGVLELVAASEHLELHDAALRLAEWFAINTQGTQLPRRKEKAMSGNQPSHKVFVVEGEGEEAFWTRVGSAWPHKDGKGFNVNLSAVPTNGRLVLRVPNDEEAEKKQQPKKR